MQVADAKKTWSNLIRKFQEFVRLDSIKWENEQVDTFHSPFDWKPYADFGIFENAG